MCRTKSKERKGLFYFDVRLEVDDAKELHLFVFLCTIGGECAEIAEVFSSLLCNPLMPARH